MNIKAITILTACAFLTGGCNKSPTSTTTNSSNNQPPPPPVQAEPFHGQIYKSLDGRNVLTLTSKDECELMQDGTTLPCKYTKQTDALRVIATVMGTPQVIYYRFTEQGIQDNNGNVLLSPEKYTAAIEQQRQQQMEELQKQREAERKQLEEQRVAEVIAKSKEKTLDIASYTLAPSEKQYTKELDPTRGTVTLTDVSLVLSTQTYSQYAQSWVNEGGVINFASIHRIGEVGSGTKPNGFIVEEQTQNTSLIQLYYSTDSPTSLYFNTEANAHTVHDAVVNAYNTWKAKYPEAVLH